MPPDKSRTKPRHRVLTQLTLPSGRTLEPGAVTENIPPGDIRWLRDQQAIESVTNDVPIDEDAKWEPAPEAPVNEEGQTSEEAGEVVPTQPEGDVTPEDERTVVVGDPDATVVVAPGTEVVVSDEAINPSPSKGDMKKERP